MRAICLEQNTVHFQRNHPAPTVGEGEVLIDVIQAGICETDLQLVRGYMEFSGILGHEFVGRATTGDFQGRRVVGEINCNCKKCIRCHSGFGNHCANRTVVGIFKHDGAFAEQVAIPQSSLHFIPDSITDDQAVLIEPLAAALEIGTQMDLSVIRKAIVLGDGRLAYLCALAISEKVKDLSVVGKHDLKLERFRKLGMEAIKLDELECEKAFDLVVDCTGSVTGLPLALELVEPRGTIVMKTTVVDQHQLSLAPIVIDEVKLLGSRCGPFDQAIAMLEAGRVNLTGLITNRFPLEAAQEAFQAAVDPAAFKVVFELNGASVT